MRREGSWSLLGLITTEVFPSLGGVLVDYGISIRSDDLKRRKLHVSNHPHSIEPLRVLEY